MADPIICDTSIWLYLGYIGYENLLKLLYAPIYTTEVVCQELDTGRNNRSDIINPRQLSWVQAVRPLLEKLHQEGFYISEALLEYALKKANED